jgi:hypothetical protein
MSQFASPDVAQDRKDLAAVAQTFGGVDWKTKRWKPKSKPSDNIIRILPARTSAAGKATYHIRAGVHFVAFEDRKERFVCNKETYGTYCPACEEFDRLARVNDKGAARYRVKKLGLFNIIDRSNPGAGPLLWEAPLKSVWMAIVDMVANRSNLLNLFTEYDKDGNAVRLGRDVLVMFDRSANPESMYKLQLLDPSPLGTDEEVKAWFEAMPDLVKDRIYPAIDSDVAAVLAFGSEEERDEVRKSRKEAVAEAGESEPEEVAAAPATPAAVVSPAPQAPPAPIAPTTPQAAPVPTPPPAPQAPIAPVASAPVAPPTPVAPAPQASTKDRVAAIRRKMEEAKAAAAKK